MMKLRTHPIHMNMHYTFYSSSCSASSGIMYVGQQKPSEPSSCIQNRLRSIGVGSCGTMPCTSRSSLAGNQAGSVSSTMWKPSSLEMRIRGC